MNKEDFTSKVSSCRGNMVLNAPYFASLAFGLGIKQAKGTKVPTVDGKLFSLPDGYVEKLSKDELKGVLAAGALACGLGHPFRMGARDKKIWSMASCMIVRKAILESGFNLPADWPADHRFDSNTKIEDAYKILKEEQPPSDGPGGDGEGEGEGEGGGGGGGGGNEQGDGESEGEGEGEGGGGGMNVEPPKQNQDQDQDDNGGGGDGEGQQPQRQAASPDKQRQMEDEWNVKMVQAAQAAERSCGNVPGWMKGIIDDLLTPKVDWRDVLRRFLEETAKEDYSFVRPSRRYSGDDFSFPGLYSEGKPRLIVAIDYSGSVSKPERQQFLGELNAILEEFDIGITVVYFDCGIQGVKHYTRDDLPIQDDSGYGGTDFVAPFKWVDENVDRNPTAMIVCSDMECGSFPERYPAFPVLWVSTQPVKNVERWWPENKIPFGEVIEIDVPHEGWY